MSTNELIYSLPTGELFIVNTEMQGSYVHTTVGRLWEESITLEDACKSYGTIVVSRRILDIGDVLN